MVENKNISIVLVNWFSSNHIIRLISNLKEKAYDKEKLFFIIIDNTNGKDTKLYDKIKLINDLQKISIISFLPKLKQRSISHSLGLDRAMKEINSFYTLIIDPDTYVFQKKWDLFCIEKLKKGDIAVGAPYPNWKLGKVHNFPSPIFFFSKTKWILSDKTSWYPYPKKSKKLFNFFIRKFVRLFGFSTRKRLNNNFLVKNLSYYLEYFTGISSPDTGYHFYIKSKKNNLKSTVFKSYNFLKNDNKKKNTLIKLSNEFELYFYEQIPFLTHQYTSNIFYYKTGANPKNWINYIKQLEKSDDKK